ncbi:KilA-N domain-containing protein [Colletotrichum karsti]|uniref:KilA-N domain-containing protein n=1 Tax=Colletotrichum karsti TaxID=1095194 RepID=A0A9P6IET0_9PEZI|nr:KilA-N domain-containing protein [Colletotrichum karsti]KAF9882042.1 KilA-N domain-containing protein [Colletotrichum karsti]
MVFGRNLRGNTVKLDLPSISQVQTRGPTDVSYYNLHAIQRPLYTSNERVPSLPLPTQAYSSGTSSPRVSSFGSASSSHASQSSFTSAASSNGPKTPSPTLPITAAIPGSSSQPIGAYDSYPAMNQPAADMYYSQHMSAGQAQQPQTVTSGAMSYHQQPQPLQPTHGLPYAQQHQYAQPPYGYPNGLTSPQNAAPGNQMGGQNVLPLPGVATQGFSGFDTTGQVAPPGMKPRVTATLWEDEGSLCFQVEARGICVARREDNHMINGTKLLNVAGMTRGRRDGILKSEKVRHVVKIGPMHLKGVWIPFERALDFANKEKITELLYPLFVHNIGALLYHPTNQTRTNQVMAAAERRKQEQNQMRSAPQTGGGPGLPSIQQHHHHMGLPGPQQPLPSHAQMGGRPSLDRAHTFPTPPTSASSVMPPGMNAADNGFQWTQGQQMGTAQGNNPMSIDTGLSNTARSMPATPASTPPGTNIQNMQSYQSNAQQYDNSRSIYNPSAQQSPYQAAHTTSQDRSVYGQGDPYAKNDMGPPSARPATSGAQDQKPVNGLMHSDQTGQTVAQPAGDEEAEHEHDAEYTHDSGAYDASRASYNYSAPAVGSLPAEHQHLSPEMTGSPSHPPASGRATPRTAAAPQPYYSQQTGYNTPPRVPQQNPGSLYNVMSNDRSTAGAGSNDVYQPQADMGSMSNGYSQMNGASAGIKRGRDDDDDLQRPSSGAGMDLKRRKTLMDSSVPAIAYDSMPRATPVMAQQPRRR